MTEEQASYGAFTDDDMTALEAAREKATQGQWDGNTRLDIDLPIGESYDAAYILGANPEALGRLLARLQAAEAALVEWAPDSGSAYPHCPNCQNSRTNGHVADCAYAAWQKSKGA